MVRQAGYPSMSSSRHSPHYFIFWKHGYQPSRSEQEAAVRRAQASCQAIRLSARGNLHLSAEILIAADENLRCNYMTVVVSLARLVSRLKALGIPVPEAFSLNGDSVSEAQSGVSQTAYRYQIGKMSAGSPVSILFFSSSRRRASLLASLLSRSSIIRSKVCLGS